MLNFRFKVLLCLLAAAGIFGGGACSSQQDDAGVPSTDSGGSPSVVPSTGGRATGGGGSGGTSATGGSPGTIDGDALGSSSGGAVEEDEPDVCSLAILGNPGSNPAANFGAWISERGPDVQRFAVGAGLEELTPSQLSAFDVVLLDGLPSETMPGITASDLANWVGQGGRLVVLSGYADVPEALAVQNQMLVELELGFVTTDVVQGPVTDFVPHPITEGLTSISFIGGREVQSLPEDEVLMTVGEAHVPVGVTAVRGSGKAFLFGDEWVTFDSEWSTIPEVQQFWVNLFAWLGDCELTPIIR